MNIDFLIGCFVGGIVASIPLFVRIGKLRLIVKSYDALTKDMLDSYRNAVNYINGEIDPQEYQERLDKSMKKVDTKLKSLINN